MPTNVATERHALEQEGLEVMPRESWAPQVNYAAAAARAVTAPARWLFLHISVHGNPRGGFGASPGQVASALRKIEAIGIARFGTGVGVSYNAAADWSGTLWELQPLARRGAHTVNNRTLPPTRPDLVDPDHPGGTLNYRARALVLPQEVDDPVTDAQLEAAARWGAALRRSGVAERGARWQYHREVSEKACPGDRAIGRVAELQQLTDRYTTEGLPMAITQEDREAIAKDVVAALVGTPQAGSAAKPIVPADGGEGFEMSQWRAGAEASALSMTGLRNYIGRAHGATRNVTAEGLSAVLAKLDEVLAELARIDAGGGAGGELGPLTDEAVEQVRRVVAEAEVAASADLLAYLTDPSA